MLRLRTPTATNYNLFDAGDSVIKSETLVAVAQEFAERLVSGVRDYNLNELLEYPEPNLEYVTADRRMNFSINLPYTQDGLDKKFVKYLDSYFGWTTPTTGELAGMESCIEAYYYVLRSVIYGNQKLLETMAVKDLKDTSTAPDNGIDTIESVLSLPFTTAIDTDGKVEKVTQNYLVLLDLQERLPLV